MNVTDFNTGLTIGERHDIRLRHCCPSCNELPPKMRTITSIDLKKDPKDGRGYWLYWRWQPEAIDGEYDCGFSGVLVATPDGELTKRGKIFAQEANQ